MSKKVSHESVKNADWCVWCNQDDTFGHHQVMRAIFLDMRSSLRRIETILACGNCMDIPNILRGIRRKLPTKKRRKKT